MKEILNQQLIKNYFEHLYVGGYIVDQCFSTFFDSRHPSIVKEQFGGTPCCNLVANISQIQRYAALLELSTSPRLRTTVVDK